MQLLGQEVRAIQQAFSQQQTAQKIAHDKMLDIVSKKAESSEVDKIAKSLWENFQAIIAEQQLRITRLEKEKKVQSWEKFLNESPNSLRK